MPSVINTNIPSLNTQRNLGASQAMLNVSIQRLSTGLRVNSAKDDAAGLAIAERMNAQVRGLNVAARNANDGVSLAQTAEGALGKIGEMVQRMRELAVQSSNATNSPDDRKALQSEVSQLKEEIDRVAQTTNFNGTKLLDGSFASKIFQVGADAGQSITVSEITDAQLSSMKAKWAEVSGDDMSDTTPLATPLTAGTFKLNDKTINVEAATTNAERAKQVVEAVNKSTASTGVSASLADDGAIVLTSAENIKLEDGSITADEVGFTGGLAPTATGGEGFAGEVSMSKLDIGTMTGAQMAIVQADAAMKQINTARANLGALQSRFENAVSNIQISSENATAARSRIMDTDFAAETANMTRAQILQQAGNAMLSQANQLPQQVLSLLR